MNLVMFNHGCSHGSRMEAKAFTLTDTTPQTEDMKTIFHALNAFRRVCAMWDELTQNFVAMINDKSSAV